MENNKGLNKVDAEFKQELEFMESRLQLSMERTITTLIKEGMKEIKVSLAEIFNKDIDYIKETQERHATYHEQHVKNIENIKDSIDPKIHNAIDDKIKLLESQIATVRDTQLKCQARENITEKIEEKTERHKNTNYGFVVMLCTIVSVITGVIVYFIK